MSQPTDDGDPPLGERTPSRPRRRARRPGPAVLGAVALVVGLVAGFALARVTDPVAGGDAATSRSVDGEGREERDGGEDGGAAPSTTAPTVPEECVATMRSAQRALALLDKGLQDVRDFDVAGVKASSKELRRLRRDLDRRVGECAERIRR